jgi:putative dimethyl sulfoxide reductase chaperone
VPEKDKASPQQDKERTSSSEGIQPFLEARAFAYDILKCVFWQAPARKFIKLLIEGEIVQAFPFADSSVVIRQAIDRIGKYLEQPDILSRKSYEHLHWDYTRMFIGPGKVPAPPWESIYRDVEHLHFSEETLEVRNAYRKYNLVLKDFGHEPDDHLGLELDFLHKLSEMAGERAESADETGLAEILKDQQVFLDEHLLKWVPDWTKDVVRSAETDFYKGMAQLLEAYLHFDRETIGELLDAPRQKPPESV